jgi:chromosome segregation ATPase
MSGTSLFLCLLLAACTAGPDGWTPVLEETSTGFLRTETQAVALHVSSALADLREDPDKATSELEAAEDRLDHLTTYYLPLLAAREHSYNAYRHFYLGEIDKTNRDLDSIEELLMSVSESDPGHLLREMESPLETLETARAALEVDGDKAATALRELATRLDFLLVKGDLVLTE